MGFDGVVRARFLITGNSIGAEGTKVIIEGLRKNTSITEIDLGCC